MTAGTRIDAREAAVVRLLEQLREAGFITAFGFLAASDEAWVEVSPDLTALVAAGCGPLLEPTFWECLARDAGLDEVRAAVESTESEA